MKAVNIDSALISRWDLPSAPRPGQISDYREQVLTYKKVCVTGEMAAFYTSHYEQTSKPRGVGWLVRWLGFLIK